MRKIIKDTMIAAAIVLVAVGTAGCGKKDAASDADVTKVIVGTGNAYEPYCYLDDKGELAGYEYEVLKAVDELLPEYEFEYQTSDFTNLLISLDAGKIDIAAHQFEPNEEREKKYLFGTEAYTTYTNYLVVTKDRTDINSLDDLQGLTVRTKTGSNSAYILENYNKEHSDNPIKLEYVDNATDEETVTALVNGVWDAVVQTDRAVEKLNESYSKEENMLKIVGEPILYASTYFVFDKENTKLQEAVDGAVKKLKESGKLAEISTNVIGGDYTESE